MKDQTKLAELRERAKSASGPGVISCIPNTTLLALIEAVEAVHRDHVRTGFCLLCEFGPPPHHDKDCPLAPFDFSESA